MQRVIFVASIAAVLAAAVPAGAQDDLHTAWGDPNLGGVWDFRTITPLQRPEEFADREFLTAEEAARAEQEVVDRNQDLLEREAERTEAADQVDRRSDGSPGFYNNFWLDRGTRTIDTLRTSLVIDRRTAGCRSCHQTGRNGLMRVAPTGRNIRPTRMSTVQRPTGASSASTPARRSRRAATTRTCRSSRRRTMSRW